MNNFNEIRNRNEKIEGTLRKDTYDKDFNLYYKETSIKDLRYITCKLDRAFINDGWKVKSPTLLPHY